ncbi:MAG: guanylate kinase [Spirochaetia bacterium]|jgi:guanylate kinase|nr:guanylate kinase [Spirochaetia bacterium]
MPQNNLSIVVTAPSGTGKTTVIKELLSQIQEIEFSVSSTTRVKRSEEKEGIDYYFITLDVFKKGIDNHEFIEWAEVHGNFYGTLKKEIDRIKDTGRIPILDVDVQGSKTLKDKIDNAVFILIVPPSLGTLEARLRSRETETEAEIELRLRSAVSELNRYPLFDYIVVNDELSESVLTLKSIIRAEKSKTGRMAGRLKRILEARNDNSI